MMIQLSLYGIVQGVGYRPYAVALAKKYGITGYVKNDGGTLSILAEGEEKALSCFTECLTLYPPPSATVTSFEKEVIACECDQPKRKYNDFTIIKSGKDKTVMPLISPDIATCQRCEREMYDIGNRRYRHPFISCTDCGPRYSIISALPYDRCNIVMDKFPLCDDCESEYTTLGNIRMHAQTIACKKCGPTLYFDNSKESPIEKAITALLEGKIVAIKDIGGYHLAALANNEAAARRIREIKNREKKPFAVMFDSISTIFNYTAANNIETDILTSSARPIVLVKAQAPNCLAPSVCMDSPDIGAMLPCNPVQIMLTNACHALIMTSANRSGEPIITKDDDIFKLASEFGFSVLSHDRDILTPLDDSVVRVVCGRVQMIRRARGYVPMPINIGMPENDSRLICMGGDLKATFALVSENTATLSQYFGDLDDIDSMQAYSQNIDRMCSLYSFKPQAAVYDMHPAYRSAAAVQKFNCEKIAVQHHKAHIASVIAEHQLNAPVIGFAFDGTGYGDDGTIWGSEAFVFDSEFISICHLSPILMCGSDESSKDATLTLDCYKYACGVTNIEPIIAAALKNRINTHVNRSMGRLFDAVSAMLGICLYNEYEGQCAIELERAATVAGAAYTLKLERSSDVWETAKLINQIEVALKDGVDPASIALGFHLCIADAIHELVTEYKIKNVVLSGGVFQNRLLTENVINRLENQGYNVYINEKVPTNDGGIALGQAYIAANILKER